MSPDQLFDTGFPGPSVSSKDIDTLPSRIAQAKGQRDATIQRATGQIDGMLEPVRSLADQTVSAMAEPIDIGLTAAGQTAANTVIQGQMATVKSLQSPLLTAVRYGYVNQGTPILSPTGRKGRKKGGESGQTPSVPPWPTVPTPSSPPAPPPYPPSSQYVQGQGYEVLAASPPPAPPPPPPMQQPPEVAQGWTTFLECGTRMVAMVPDGAATGPYMGYRPPRPWSGGYGFRGTFTQLVEYLIQFGEEMYNHACAWYIDQQQQTQQQHQRRKQPPPPQFTL